MKIILPFVTTLLLFVGSISPASANYGHWQLIKSKCYSYQIDWINWRTVCAWKRDIFWGGKKTGEEWKSTTVMGKDKRACVL